MVLNVNGLPVSSRSETIAAGGSLNFRLEDSGSVPKTGWAQVYATRPIAGMAAYQYIDGGKIISEATVFPSSRTQKMLLMTPILGSSSDSGLAIANPSDKSAIVSLRLLNANGIQMATSQLALGPAEQVSRFCTQFFPGFTNFPEGSVEVTSSQGIISVGLLYQFQFLMSGSDIFTTIPITPIP